MRIAAASLANRDLAECASVVLGLPSLGDVKTTTSRRAQDTPITVRLADACEHVVALVVPDSGADVEAVERALITFALETTGGNRTRAARFLGLSRSALIYRMHKHGLVKTSEVPEAGRSEGKSSQ